MVKNIGQKESEKNRIWIENIGIDQMELSGIGIDKMEMTPCLTQNIVFILYALPDSQARNFCLFVGF